MKQVYLLFASILFCCTYAVAQSGDVAGNDSIADENMLQTAHETDVLGHYELNIGDFSNLNVVDGLNVEYHCSQDSAGMVLFETTRDIAANILFENNKKGKLTIQKQFHQEDELQTGLPTIHVYARFLVEVTNAGDSTVRVLAPKPTVNFKASLIGNGRLVVRDLDCNKLEAAIKTGNGTLMLTGTCREAVFSNTGVGTILADGLETVDASCRFFGKGTTGVWVTGSLVVKGMFPGKLYYKGNPKKVRNFGMGVKVMKMPDE